MCECNKNQKKGEPWGICVLDCDFIVKKKGTLGLRKLKVSEISGTTQVPVPFKSIQALNMAFVLHHKHNMT